MVRDWNAAGLQDRLAPLTWNRVWPGQPGPILAWLRHHEPERLAASTNAVMSKDFIRARLVGTARTELTDESCSGLYDKRPTACATRPSRRSGSAASSDCSRAPAVGRRGR